MNSKLAMSQAGALFGPDAAKNDHADNWFNQGHSTGSGPYVITSYLPNQQVVLTRNDKYWGPKAAFPQISLQQVDNSSAQLQMLQRGAADIAMQISFDSLQTLKSSKGLTAKVAPSFDYVHLTLNPAAKGGENLQDQRVRQAIALAIDYNRMINVTVNGYGGRQASPIPNGFAGTSNLPLPQQNLTKARQLMAQAGKPSGFSLDMTYMTKTVYGVNFDTVAQALQQDLQKIGINLQLHPVTENAWISQAQGSGIPATLVYFAPDYPNPADYVGYYGRVNGSCEGTPCPAPHVSTDPAEQRLLDEAKTVTGDKQNAIWAKLGQMMINDALTIPLVNPDILLASASDITGMNSSLSDLFDITQLGLK